MIDIIMCFIVELMIAGICFYKANRGEPSKPIKRHVKPHASDGIEDEIKIIIFNDTFE